jgi:hypothetical protein
MKDKDTKILEEAYGKINEAGDFYHDSVFIDDETSLKPQQVKVINNGDGTISVQFNNRFSISRSPKESIKKLIVLLSRAVESNS